MVNHKGDNAGDASAQAGNQHNRMIAQCHNYKKTGKLEPIKQQHKGGISFDFPPDIEYRKHGIEHRFKPHIRHAQRQQPKAEQIRTQGGSQPQQQSCPEQTNPCFEVEHLMGRKTPILLEGTLT